MSAAPTAVATRSFYHPIQRDRATFLETSEESGGERTLIELEVAPGGGNVLHRHDSFSERFEAIEGELTVHAPVTAHIELRPGHLGFERAIQIAYGLAADRLGARNGGPKNLVHLAILSTMSGSRMSGAMRILEPVFGALARWGRRKGLEREFIARYCAW